MSVHKWIRLGKHFTLFFFVRSTIFNSASFNTSLSRSSATATVLEATGSKQQYEHVLLRIQQQNLPFHPISHPETLAIKKEYDQEIHRYDPETRQWRECGQLPVGIYGSSCAVLPSGDLMVGALRENVDRKH